MGKYVLTLCGYIVAVSASALVLAPSTVCFLSKEDGFFEYFTAFCLLAASILFFLSYRKANPESKPLGSRPAARLFFLGLSIAFFIGFGEELSWGQRIFHIQSPEFVKKANIQEELNIHNLNLFNLVGKNNQMKPLWKRYLTTITGLFHVFSVIFCLLVPFADRYLPFAKKKLGRISFPVVPLEIGLFFALSWILYKALVALRPGLSEAFFSSLAEIKESQIAFLFMVIAFFFFRKASRPAPANER